ncbi:hypothetical protein scyTo_0026231 [Scyliorhinus torazame]|uniref:Uncharacterized protein n=1 Tax=Scyliorhinus torazame TaxID=75743 RepID=A0A401QJN7_SCYTO|nr:hypothetical protein [Scyliorhinus torazame]
MDGAAEEMLLEYPDWALAMMILLIIMACLPIPVVYIHQMMQDRLQRHAAYSACVYVRGDGPDEPTLPMNEEEVAGRNGYLKVEADEEELERAELLAEEDAFEMDDMSQDKKDVLSARV